MNYKFLILLITGSFLVSGCYTQLETIERERPERSYASQNGSADGSAYDNYYTEEEYQLYEQGYFDGVFDANLDFRSYSYRRTTIGAGFHWGRPFYGYGYSYGYYYDPFWRYSQLYDPYFYSFYGYYRYPYYSRYRHFGHFYSPWSGFGSNYVVIYNNVGSTGSSSVVQGPRGSGVHRGTVTNTRDNRVASAGVATRDDRTRVRNGSNMPTGYVNTANTRIRNSDRVVVPNTRATAATTVDRRRGVPAQTQRAIPQRTRPANNSGNVNRNSGSPSNNSGTVNRTRNTQSNNSGTVNRPRSGNTQQASPQRSRNSSNNNNSSGNRSRDRGNN